MGCGRVGNEWKGREKRGRKRVKIEGFLRRGSSVVECGRGGLGFERGERNRIRGFESVRGRTRRVGFGGGGGGISSRSGMIGDESIVLLNK